MEIKIKNLIILIVLSNLIFSNFISAQSVKPLTIIENINEIKKKEKIQINFWDYLKEKWQEEIMPIFKKIGNFFKKTWNSYIFPKLNSLWKKNINLFKKEIERRKTYIKEKFQKEKKEIKTELPRNSKNIWGKIKELIKI